MNHRSVHELMSRDVSRIAPDASLQDAAQAMSAANNGCLVVVEDNIPVGIVTARDLIKALAQSARLLLSPVSSVMSTPPVCLNEEAKIHEALAIMQSRNLRYIPVTDRAAQLTGLLTESAIAAAHFSAAKDTQNNEQDRTNELLDANKKLRALALQDSLLRIGNRRAMEVDLHFTHVNAVRYGRPYAVALLDVDFFKRYNDHYGHPAGDEVLKQVAVCIKSSIRSGDRLYRYGGEEFLVLMPETILEEAMEAMQRVVNNMQALHVPHGKSPYGIVTLSAGVGAVVDAKVGSNWQVAANEADRQLYLAKEQGRNQVCWQIAQQPRPTDTQSMPCVH